MPKKNKTGSAKSLYLQNKSIEQLNELGEKLDRNHSYIVSKAIDEYYKKYKGSALISVPNLEDEDIYNEIKKELENLNDI